MKTVFFLSLSLALILVSVPRVQAQVDPSSAILLRSGGSAPTKDELDSSRYSIRPDSPRSSEPSTQPTSNTTTKVKVTTIEEEEKREPSKSSTVEVKKIEVSSGESTDTGAEEERSEENKNLVEGLREIILGGSTDEVDSYLGQVKPSDPRNNIIELTVAPFIFYDDSNSNYWYRDYHSYGPGLLLNAKLWLSPFFGVSTTYKTSFNAEIPSSASQAETEPVEHSWFGAELQFRNYFGISYKAPSLTFGLGFNEYQMKTKADSNTRIGVKTSGLKLSVESMIPVSRGIAWTMGLELMPRASHQENRSQIEPKSGKHSETNVVGLSLGRKYTFDRSQVLFWKLQHHFEKNAFKDTATMADPQGNQPSNVSVTHTKTFLTFGFTWGN